jgi:hypothetical protein
MNSSEFTNKSLELIFKKIKENDPNWKENIEKGFYMPKQTTGDGDGIGFLLITFIFLSLILGLIGLIKILINLF